MDTAKRVAPTTYNVCLLFWVAKLETSHQRASHVLQSNKKTNGIGGATRLAVSIQLSQFLVHFSPCTFGRSMKLHLP